MHFSFFIRFDKKRTEEELEVVRRKESHLRVQTEGSSIVEKLQEELREYREILKCSICLDRTKEVIILFAIFIFYGLLFTVQFVGSGDDSTLVPCLKKWILEYDNWSLHLKCVKHDEFYHGW